MQRDDLLERCDLARESNSERKLAQVGSPVDFQLEFRKRAIIARALTARMSQNKLNETFTQNRTALEPHFAHLPTVAQ